MSHLKEHKESILLPRKGSFEYNFLLAEKKKQKKIINRFKFMNKYLIRPLYKMGLIPLFGFNKFMILLYTKGRKSGLERITPLGHHIIAGVIHIFVGRGKKADWFRNMIANPDEVYMKKGFKKYHVKFEIIKEKEVIIEVFKWYVTNNPLMSRFVFGWKKNKDDVNKADFSFLAESLSIIKLWKK